MEGPDQIKLNLCRREIDDESLGKLAEAVASLDALGFPASDVFPLGIVVQDGAGVSFEVTPDRLPALVAEIVKLGELRPGIEVFPKGVIRLDRFDVRATVGRSGR